MNVQMPDGTVAQFPDNMSLDEIKNVIEAQGQTKGEAPTAAAAPATPSWLSESVGGPLAYVGARTARGLGRFAQGMALGESQTSPMLRGMVQPEVLRRQVIPGGLDYDLGEATFQALGAPQAPGPVSRYAGAVGEAFGQNPLLGAMAPMATIGGALAGEAGHEAGLGSVGTALAGMAGGGLLGLAGAGLHAIQQLGAVRRLASSLGSSETKQQLGAVAKTEATDWMENEANPKSLPGQEKAAWAPVDESLPRSTVIGPRDAATGEPLPGAVLIGPDGPKVDLSDTESMLKGILKVGAEDTRRSEISAMAGGGAADKLYRMLGVEKPIGSGSRFSIEPMEWDGVRELRTFIGQGMKDPILQKIGEKNLDRLYLALTNDLKRTAEAHGLLDEFNQANAVSERLRDIATNHIGKIAQAVTPEAAYKALVPDEKLGGTKLGIIREQLPTTADETAALHLREATKDPKVWNRLAPEAQSQMVVDPNDLEMVKTAMKLPHISTGGGTAVRSILGGELGAHIGQAALSHAFGPETGAAIGSGVGAIVPPAWEGLKALGRNPAVLRYPAIGAMAAPYGEGEPVTVQRQGNVLVPSAPTR